MIKWENIKVLNSALTNKIYLGKVDKTGLKTTDKSGERTDEIINAVMQYLDNELRGNEKKIIITCQAGQLTWERKVKNG